MWCQIICSTIYFQIKYFNYCYTCSQVSFSYRVLCKMTFCSDIHLGFLISTNITLCKDHSHTIQFQTTAIFEIQRYLKCSQSNCINGTVLIRNPRWMSLQNVILHKTLYENELKPLVWASGLKFRLQQGKIYCEYGQGIVPFKESPMPI
jgi:hypothetical protein